MAYLMQYQKMGLMDAYLLTRARRLNVLIQPNLRFFHELFGWEVELAKREEEELRSNGGAGDAGVRSRRIMYSWPAFCRDIVSCRSPGSV
jgi:dual specificity MAP kinase phosphatase